MHLLMSSQPWPTQSQILLCTSAVLKYNSTQNTLSLTAIRKELDYHKQKSVRLMSSVPFLIGENFIAQSQLNHSHEANEMPHPTKVGKGMAATYWLATTVSYRAQHPFSSFPPSKHDFSHISHSSNYRLSCVSPSFLLVFSQESVFKPAWVNILWGKTCKNVWEKCSIHESSSFHLPAKMVPYLCETWSCCSRGALTAWKCIRTLQEEGSAQDGPATAPALAQPWSLPLSRLPVPWVVVFMI